MSHFLSDWVSSKCKPKEKCVHIVCTNKTLDNWKIDSVLAFKNNMINVLWT